MHAQGSFGLKYTRINFVCITILLTNSDKPTREVNLHAFCKIYHLSQTKNLIFEPIVYQFIEFALHIITKSTNLNGSYMLRHIVSHM